MSRAELLKNPIGKALTLISEGLNTFGAWPRPGRTAEEQEQAKKTMGNIAKTYAIACMEESRITPEIIEATAKRYLQGKVTIWKDGLHQPASTEFPTAPQFRDACVQTWASMYGYLGIEQVDGSIRMIEYRRSMTPEQIDAIKNVVREELGIPHPCPGLPMSEAKCLEARSRIQSRIAHLAKRGA